jgi:cobalt-zinc-cadmium efflux system outer membrane protein
VGGEEIGDMRKAARQCLIWALGLFVAHGCAFPVREQVDGAVRHMASEALDAGVVAPPPKPPVEKKDEAPAGPPLTERLKIPTDLPGATAPPIRLPRLPENSAERERTIGRLYPALPPLGELPAPAPGPNGEPLALTELQRLGVENNPTLRQAVANLEAARGAAVQAGLYPNPSAGYSTDTIGTGPGAGYQGGYFEQKIVTAGKVKLNAAQAAVDVQTAELALRKARMDLIGQIRGGYFAVLVAEENMRVSLALARFTDELYRIQVEQVKNAQAAAYEPLQIHVLAVQARAVVVQARNRYTAAWKQLAATLGTPGMPPTALAGRADMAAPLFVYDEVLARVLNIHTDVGAARASVQKSRYGLRLAQVTPIPDLDFIVKVQKDYTTLPFHITPSVQIGMPIPIFDRNQGAIAQAQSQLLKTTEEEHRVRTDLTSRLAEAFERYENNRQILEYYQRHILSDQVRAYRGVYERHQQEPDKVNFGDIVVAQQLVTGAITSYMTTLSAFWTAVVDVATLMQVEDLFPPGGAVCLGPVPLLEWLQPLPCRHCSPLPPTAVGGADGSWPRAVPPIPGDPVLDASVLPEPKDDKNKKSEPAPKEEAKPKKEEKPTNEQKKPKEPLHQDELPRIDEKPMGPAAHELPPILRIQGERPPARTGAPMEMPPLLRKASDEEHRWDPGSIEPPPLPPRNSHLSISPWDTPRGER